MKKIFGISGKYIRWTSVFIVLLIILPAVLGWVYHSVQIYPAETNKNLWQNYCRIWRLTAELGPVIIKMNQEYSLLEDQRLEDYNRCSVNFNLAQRDTYKIEAVYIVGDAKELIHYYMNTLYKDLSAEEAHHIMVHNLAINRFGLQRGLSGNWSSAEEACAHLKGAATVNQ